MTTTFMRRTRTLRLSGDEGVALPMVLGTMFVLTAFLLASLALVLTNMRPARADQDSRAALAAAQAGIDEYVSQLSASGGQYWTNGGVDPANLAFDSTPATPACDGPGRRVPGAGGTAARFCYRVVSTVAQTARDGVITLEVTGTSTPPAGGRGESQRLTTTLRPSGFVDFIYFTDVEVLDPELLGQSANCEKHYYNGRPRSGCTEIQWGPNDVVDGPLHSNDALQVGGPTWFKGPGTTSSWPANKGGDPNRLWWGPGIPKASGEKPAYSGTLPLPAGNQELLRFVQPKIDTNANTVRPGCLYRGATRITFEGATMKILSPNTTSAPAHCLNVSRRGLEQTLAIPPVIYIKPTAGTPCSGVGYPRTNVAPYNVSEATNPADVTTTDYNPCLGTAFVEGKVDGQVTVSAENDVVVTADLTVQDRNSADIIGLVAGNYVWVYHPVFRYGSSWYDLVDYDDDSTTKPVRTIEAAVLSLRHSILVQNWNKGRDLGNLTVFGALAQKFRGPVGTTGNTGYDKDYVYDKRLKNLQPPYFLAPDNAPWQPVQVTDG